jgi:hypothetical protein
VPFNDPTGKLKDEIESKRLSENAKLETIHVSADISVEQELEAQIIRSLGDEVVQERIRGLLQDIMKKELSMMSNVLREAIRNWIFKEKQKYNLAPQSPQPQLLTEKLEQVESDYRQLENENKRLKREMELKAHENKIMLSAIKKLRPGPN